MRLRAAALIAAVAGSSGCGGSPAPRPKAAVPAPKAAESDAEAKLVAMATVMPIDIVESQLIAKANEPVSLKLPRQGPRRSGGEVVPFRLTDLPVVVVPAPLADKDAPKRAGGELPAELAVKLTPPDYRWDPSLYRSATVTGRGFLTGTVKVGPWEGGFFTRDGGEYGGLSVPCGRAEPWGSVVAARWEGIQQRPGPQGGTTYTIVDGWFDRVLCRASVVRRTTAALAEVVPDTLYAFRQCLDEECSGQTSVSLVIPSAMQVVALGLNTEARRYTGMPYPRVTIPLRRGGSQSVIAQLYLPNGNYAYKGRGQLQRTLSVEISQGTSDDEPLATAFLAETAMR